MCLIARSGHLNDAIKRAEDWGQKGKFPPSIKPLLNSIAVQAIKLDQYDDYFFALMPELFPYNKFTMTVRSSAPYPSA